MWSASQDKSDLLAGCHRNSLRVADELGARSVAFPANVEEVRFVLFDQAAYDIWAEVLAR